MRIIGQNRRLPCELIFKTPSKQIVLNKNTYFVKTDTDVDIFFTKGIDQFYDYASNDEFFSYDKIVLFYNFIKKKDFSIEKVDKQSLFGKDIYSIGEYRGIIFLIYEEQ